MRKGFRPPKTYGLCTDDSVIGAMFYIMHMVEGRVFWDQTLPAVAREKRRPIFEAEILTLAKLHSYDPEKIGLGDFGRPGNYFSRQVDRWTKQYRASETEKIEEVERLIEWLPKTVPQQERVSVVHGDYRLDNMIFAPDKPQVHAVLDWELSTLGDPLADFTYLLMQWIMSSGGGRTGLVGAGPAVAEHSNAGRGDRDLLQGDGPSEHSGPELVLLLQPVPSHLHPAGHCRPHPRRHRVERPRVRKRRTRRAAGEGVVGVCGEGGGGVAPPASCPRAAARTA